MQSDPVVVVFVFTSHQQLRSYGDGATSLNLIQQTGGAGNRTCDPWFTIKASGQAPPSDSVNRFISSPASVCKGYQQSTKFVSRFFSNCLF